MDATELCELLRSRTISAVEAVQQAVDRMERVNPMLNAVVSERIDEALRDARVADQEAAAGRWRGPLHGLPILIKDLFDFRPGMRHTFGCPATAQFSPAHASAHVERLETAGAIILGKTNTPEFGHKGTTDNSLFGPTRCPFDLTRNAGGSSGGSAAAVAVGITHVAQGSDAGGSIRIPAAWCGVVGFKPTFGRIPNTGGLNAFGAHTPFVHSGPLSRTVRDAALMAEVMSGPHPDDPFSLPDDKLRMTDFHKRDARKLRIGFSADFGVFSVDPVVAKVVEENVADLSRNGLEITKLDMTLPLDQSELAALWCRMVGLAYLDLFAALSEIGYDVLVDSPDDVPPEIHEMVDTARTATPLAIRQDDWARSKVWRKFQSEFENYDIILTPTLGALPVKNERDGRTLGPTAIAGRTMERTIGWCLTHPVNFTGHPAASVPAGMTEEGLPVGLQVIGRRFRDDDVLAICHAVETTRPWGEVLDQNTNRLLSQIPADGSSVS